VAHVCSVVQVWYRCDDAIRPLSTMLRSETIFNLIRTNNNNHWLTHSLTYLLTVLTCYVLGAYSRQVADVYHHERLYTPANRVRCPLCMTDCSVRTVATSSTHSGMRHASTATYAVPRLRKNTVTRPLGFSSGWHPGSYNWLGGDQKKKRTHF